MVPCQLAYDETTDTLLIRVPAAEGEGDVTLRALDCGTLTANDKRRLAHVRPPDQAQRPPSTGDLRGPK